MWKEILAHIFLQQSLYGRDCSKNFIRNFLRHAKRFFSAFPPRNSSSIMSRNIFSSRIFLAFFINCFTKNSYECRTLIGIKESHSVFLRELLKEMSQDFEELLARLLQNFAGTPAEFFPCFLSVVSWKKFSNYSLKFSKDCSEQSCCGSIKSKKLTQMIQNCPEISQEFQFWKFLQNFFKWFSGESFLPGISLRNASCTHPGIPLEILLVRVFH